MAALDGLRGIAALVVVAHHALLVWPALYAQYTVPNRGSRTWWLTFTPLHLGWAGREAVIVFFILSGFVLVLPYLSSSKVGTWPGYLVRRLLRLYPPVAAALVLSVVLVAAFPRDVGPDATYWLRWHDIDLTWSGVLHDLLLVDGTGMVNTVLWSLRYEVAFSILLPLVVLLARRIPARLALTLPASIGFVALGQHAGSHWAQWLPIFGVGVVMAVGRDDLRRLGERIEASAFRGVLWCALGAVAGALLLAEWVFRGVGVPTATWFVAAPPLITLGGALTCFIVLGCPAVSRLCSGRVLQWAGRISFSLYLVHEPVVVSVATLMDPGALGAVVTLVVGGGLSIALAMAFHALVEAPCTRWSRNAGRRIDRRGRPRSLHVPYRHSAAASRRGLPGPRPGVPAQGRGLVDAR
jgi:peptidoglycan/LPS O-acetylase OafA/YrhL